MTALKRSHQVDLVNFLTSYKCLRQQIHMYAADLKRSIVGGQPTTNFPAPTTGSQCATSITTDGHSVSSTASASIEKIKL